MAEFDFAVLGTDPFSGLLAGILARDHGRKVVRVGRRPSAQRLWRTLPLALPMATRPAIWGLVRHGETEIRDLLASLAGPAAVTRSEVAIRADTDLTAMALDHLVHMASGYGHQVRRLENGWAVRHVSMLDRDAIEARLGDWLDTLGVRSVEHGPVDAALAVLADDGAMLDDLAESRRPATLVSRAMTSTLIVTPRPPPVPVQHFLDRGVTLVARPGNAILALVAGEHDVDARLASTLAGPFPVKRLASTRYRQLIPQDGAPLIGRIKGTKQFIAAGLGDCGVFLAPAVARFLAGAAEREEKSWFTSHDPSRQRTTLAELIPFGASA